MAVRGLTVSSRGVLLLDGARFRNIGMNYVGGVSRIYSQPSASAISYTPSQERADDMATLKAMGVKVIRVAAFPYWPAQWTVGYLGGKAWNAAVAADKAAYYAQVDDMVAKAKAAGIGIIFSMFFRFASVSDLVGEVPRQWLVAGSNTRAFAGQVIDEFVSRYATEEGVYGWEFSNELNHRNDQPDPLGSWPGLNSSYGTRTDYNAANTIFNGDEFSTVLAWFYARVRVNDTARLVMSGNGPNSFFGSYAISYPLATWIAEMARDNPMNSRSMHFYGGGPYCSKDWYGLSSFLTSARHFAQANGQAFVLGEFGNQPLTGCSFAASGAVVTVTSTIDSQLFAGETIEVRGLTPDAYNGIFPVASVSADRKTFTYVAASAPAASSASGTSAIQFRDRIARQMDDIVKANVDLAMIWEYTRDPGAPLMAGSGDPFNAWQAPLITAANARMV
jgi:hypothetical protein